MPICTPRALVGIVLMLSQLTTEGPARPFAVSTGTSLESPRIVVVIGATVTVERRGRTSSRVRTRTGRALSRCAMWIVRISQAETADQSHTRPNPQALDLGRCEQGYRRRVRQPRGGVRDRAPA